MTTKATAVYGPFLETSLVSFDFEGDIPANYDYYGPNHRFSELSFASVSEAKKWEALENEWLYLAWTPNQSSQERMENGDRMAKIRLEMHDLER